MAGEYIWYDWLSKARSVSKFWTTDLPQQRNHQWSICSLFPCADLNFVAKRTGTPLLTQMGKIRTWMSDNVPCIVWGATVYPKKYAHGFCFAVLCCGYTLTDFPISIRLTSLALWQSNDCPSASKATLMNMDKHLMWIHYERLHNHNKAQQNRVHISWDILYYSSMPNFNGGLTWSPLTLTMAELQHPIVLSGCD